MTRLYEIVLLLTALALLFLCGCGEYRPPIIDIRDAPQVNLMGWSIPGIEDFRGYDSHFKFENMLKIQEEKMR